MQVVDCSSRLKIALRMSIRDQGFSGTSSSSAGFAASLRRWCFSSSSFSGSLSGCSSGNLNLNFIDASIFSRSGARLSFLGSQSAVGCKLGCGRLSERSRAAVVMAANGSLLGKLHLRSGFLTSLGLLSSSSALSSSSSSSNVAVFTCGLKPVVMCWNVSGNSDGQDRRRMQFLHSCSFDGCGIWGSPAFPSSLQKIREFHSSGSAACSAGAASELSFGGSSRDDLLDNTTVSSSDQKKSGDEKLKLRSGSCYLPHPDKEETGGEDAHFICTEEQAIGVADGVGGWADLGVDAGQYARELMSHSVEAIQEEPKGSVDPSRVLEKAYSITKARGSSTACIIALNEQGIQAVNLGDSGFIIVRDGCTVFRSPVQQHDFNFTYQLENGNHSDLPSSGQIFNISVAPGDVIIAGTDGLFDNLYNNEVTAVVVHAIRAGLGPQVTAQKIAALARQRALDQNRQTPFSTAAQDAGYRYYGGKLDDITVVVSYITSTSASR